VIDVCCASAEVIYELISFFFFFLIMAIATFTRLDAFCALQDPWQFKHLLTIVLLIRTSSRYVFLWYLIYLCQQFCY